MVGKLVQEHYQKGEGAFEDVLSLSECDTPFEEIHALCPRLSKGWYELSKLECETRIEFVRDFWLKTLPFQPGADMELAEFFESLDDIGIYVVKVGEEYFAEMAYSLASNAAFFIGREPATEQALKVLARGFESLPRDYLAFFQIHNGFLKNGDGGVIEAEKVKLLYDQFQMEARENERPILCHNMSVDPTLLIPFYEKYGMGSYQCFFADWYPANEMGNVFYSALDSTISNYTDLKIRREKLAFESFTSFLIFYLKGYETLKI